MYGVERGCTAVVWPIGQHPTNKNEVILWDLAHDPSELLGLSAAAIRERLFSKQDDLPEGVSRLPIKTLHINKSPVVIGNLKTLSPAMAERWGIDLAAALRHADVAASLGGVLDGLWGEVYARPTPERAPDVDEDLYGGFIGNNDRRTLQRLRGLAPEALAQARPAFDDGRLEELLFRYRARNWPATLDDSGQARWQQHCSERLHDGVHGGLTLQGFFDRIDTLSESADECGQELLGALYDYAEAIAPPPP
jgi:exodeoxyribonuclease-1